MQPVWTCVYSVAMLIMSEAIAKAVAEATRVAIQALAEAQVE